MILSLIRDERLLFLAIVIAIVVPCAVFIAFRSESSDPVIAKTDDAVKKKYAAKTAINFRTPSPRRMVFGEETTFSGSVPKQQPPLYLAYLTSQYLLAMDSIKQDEDTLERVCQKNPLAAPALRDQVEQARKLVWLSALPELLNERYEMREISLELLRNNSTFARYVQSIARNAPSLGQPDFELDASSPEKFLVSLMEKREVFQKALADEYDQLPFAQMLRNTVSSLGTSTFKRDVIDAYMASKGYSYSRKTKQFVRGIPQE